MEGQEKYLGLPASFPISKKHVFNHIYEHMHQKISGWKEQLLSMGGKEVLLNAIATTLLVYAMTCFQFPKSLNHNINSLMANFWWGLKKDETKLH